MLENSRDLFYIVLSFCVLWFTIFVSWWLFYLAQLTRNVNRVVEDVRYKLKMLFDAVDFIKDKLGMVASAVGFLSDHLFKNSEEAKGARKKKKQ